MFQAIEGSGDELVAEDGAEICHDGGAAEAEVALAPRRWNADGWRCRCAPMKLC